VFAHRHIAEAFKIPVLVTNQITVKVSHDSGGVVTAALGNSWGHAVNTRLVIQPTNSNRRQVYEYNFTTINYSVYFLLRSHSRRKHYYYGDLYVITCILIIPTQ